MWDSLRVNLPRDCMQFDDFPFDTKFKGSKDSRKFPHYSEVFFYYQAFVDKFNLSEKI